MMSSLQDPQHGNAMVADDPPPVRPNVTLAGWPHFATSVHFPFGGPDLLLVFLAAGGHFSLSVLTGACRVDVLLLLLELLI